MYKIELSGNAGATNARDREQLDGIDCQDEFSEYFGAEEDSLRAKGVENGYMRFQMIEGELKVIVNYDSAELLTPEEVDLLIDYTQGQMSDGIGEGFEQFPCCEGPCEDDNDEDAEEGEIFVSPWYHGQVLTVTQTEVI